MAQNYEILETIFIKVKNKQKTTKIKQYLLTFVVCFPTVKHRQTSPNTAKHRQMPHNNPLIIFIF
jgi:hypothetical protein